MHGHTERAVYFRVGGLHVESNFQNILAALNCSLRRGNCSWKLDHKVLNDQGYKVSSATSFVLCSHEGPLLSSVLLSNHIFCLQGHSSNVLNRDPHDNSGLFTKCPK